MKICLITTSFPRNQNDDAGIFISRLVETLAAQNVFGQVIAPFDKGANEEDNWYNWKIIRAKYGVLNSGTLAYGSGIIPNLRAKPLRILQIPGLLLSLTLTALKFKNSFDIIHTHWIASALPGIVISFITKKPLILSIRGEDLKLLSLPFLGNILKWLLKRNCQITTISEHFQEKLQKHFPSKIIHLIPNGVHKVTKNNNALTSCKLKYKISDLNYAIYAGRVIPLKRLEILIELFSLLEDKSLHLLICGSLEDSNYHEKLKAKTESLNLRSRLHFLGNVTPSDYVTLLSGSTLYCSASEYEGRPNSVLEAMAEGLLIVASDILGHSAILKDGQNGILFNSQELQSTASRIDQILKDPVSLERLGMAARNSVSELTWESCASKYIGLYRESLG